MTSKDKKTNVNSLNSKVVNHLSTAKEYQYYTSSKTNKFLIYCRLSHNSILNKILNKLIKQSPLLHIVQVTMI